MRDVAPFQPDDLDHLDRLLSQADQVVAMEDVHAGATSRHVIGLRHDVDNVIGPAVAMAEWEAVRGYRSTYYILHTSPYWEQKDLLRASLETIAGCGHEIGFHINAVTAAIDTGRPVQEIIEDAVGELRSYGHPVHGVVAHGDNACYRHRFINDEVFTESRRPAYGPASRLVGGVWLNPVPRSTYGFDYDPNWLRRTVYLSDSGGQWSRPFQEVADGFPFDGQLHILIHADWWAEAFAGLEVAA